MRDDDIIPFVTRHLEPPPDMEADVERLGASIVVAEVLGEVHAAGLDATAPDCWPPPLREALYQTFSEAYTVCCFNTMFTARLLGVNIKEVVAWLGNAEWKNHLARLNSRDNEVLLEELARATLARLMTHEETPAGVRAKVAIAALSGDRKSVAGAAKKAPQAGGALQRVSSRKRMLE